MALEKDIKFAPQLNEQTVLTHRMSLEKLTVLNSLLQNSLSNETVSVLEQEVVKIIQSWK